MATMRETIRVEFSKAMSTYTDMPRETWLFDYPAQVPPFMSSNLLLVSRCPWPAPRSPGPTR